MFCSSTLLSEITDLGRNEITGWGGKRKGKRGVSDFSKRFPKPSSEKLNIAVLGYLVLTLALMQERCQLLDPFRCLKGCRAKIKSWALAPVGENKVKRRLQVLGKGKHRDL